MWLEPAPDGSVQTEALRLRRRLERPFDRNANELRTRPHAGFLEQSLQGRLYGTLRRSGSVGDLLVGEAFENAAQNL